MKKIKKELIKKGIEQDIIWFGMEDDLLVAHIGDYWFFICEELNRTAESFSKKELIDMVYSTINDEPINDEDEEQAGEFLYYRAVLLECVK